MAHVHVLLSGPSSATQSCSKRNLSRALGAQPLQLFPKALLAGGARRVIGQESDNLNQAATEHEFVRKATTKPTELCSNTLVGAVPLTSQNSSATSPPAFLLFGVNKAAQ